MARQRFGMPLGCAALGAVMACAAEGFVDPAGLPGCETPVALTVSAGTTPRFSWTPACRVALMFVEDTVLGLDHWYIRSDAEAIVPPVDFGALPDGAHQTGALTPLVPGVRYRVVIARGKGEQTAVRTFTP